MKSFLKQVALRLPFIWWAVAKRDALRMQLRALLRMVNGRSARSRLDELRRDIGRLLRISPIFVASDRQTFLEASSRIGLSDLSQSEAGILQMNNDAKFHLRRFCLCCNETTQMLVDYEYCSADANGTRTPNWRERLVCTNCAMNNRQRLCAKLAQQCALRYSRPRVYLMEQVTPIFEWVRQLQAMEVHGSEYLGYEYKGGEQINGVRHEDVMNLSYPDEFFDLILSNDVLEHIPDPERAFRECFRVLKQGGTVLATFPFHVGYDATVTRARLAGNSVEHLLAPHYHGNPVSSDGSLVFNDFGWDLLDVMRGAGFSAAVCEMYSSDEFGHLGNGLLVFRLSKSLGRPVC